MLQEYGVRLVAVLESRPTKLWWLVGLVLFCLCLVIQLPAQWLVQKFMPNNPYLQQISGNLWQGQANWQLMTQPTAPLAGTVNWQWQPWYLLTGKLGMAVTVRSGNSALDGQVKIGKQAWQLQQINGNVTPDTLKQLLTWQLPDTSIKLKDISIEKDKVGYQAASGTLQWAGGETGYSSGGKIYRINLPTMQGNLMVDKAKNSANVVNNAGQRLHLALTTVQSQRLADLYLDNDNMLYVALTQRLLKQMPDYKGQSADDSIVVSLRQPLSSMSQ